MVFLESQKLYLMTELLNINMNVIPTDFSPDFRLSCFGTGLHAWLPEVATERPTTAHQKLKLSDCSQLNTHS